MQCLLMNVMLTLSEACKHKHVGSQSFDINTTHYATISVNHDVPESTNAAPYVL